ncbi:hypothetical protein CapIbe_005265 [Capra ibex]
MQERISLSLGCQHCSVKSSEGLSSWKVVNQETPVLMGQDQSVCNTISLAGYQAGGKDLVCWNILSGWGPQVGSPPPPPPIHGSRKNRTHPVITALRQPPLGASLTLKAHRQSSRQNPSPCCHRPAAAEHARGRFTEVHTGCQSPGSNPGAGVLSTDDDETRVTGGATGSHPSPSPCLRPCHSNMLVCADFGASSEPQRQQEGLGLDILSAFPATRRRRSEELSRRPRKRVSDMSP